MSVQLYVHVVANPSSQLPFSMLMLRVGAVEMKENPGMSTCTEVLFYQKRQTTYRSASV